MSRDRALRLSVTLAVSAVISVGLDNDHIFNSHDLITLGLAIASVLLITIGGKNNG